MPHQAAAVSAMAAQASVELLELDVFVRAVCLGDSSWAEDGSRESRARHTRLARRPR